MAITEAGPVQTFLDAETLIERVVSCCQEGIALSFLVRVRSGCSAAKVRRARSS